MLSLKNREILYLRNLVDEAECFNWVDFKDLKETIRHEKSLQEKCVRYFRSN